MMTYRAKYGIGAIGVMVMCGIGCSTSEPFEPSPDPAALRDLAPGESSTVEVAVHERWNSTRLRLHAGSTYLLQVQGKQEWNNGLVPTGAEGFWALLYQWDEQTRRVPESQWNALVGTIDGWQDHPFVIGHRCVYTPLLSGELVCYANSDPQFDWNNHGKLTLKVERLTPTAAAPPPPSTTLPVWPATQPLPGAATLPSSVPSSEGSAVTSPGASADDANFR